jgi:hypothetical protein
LGSFEKRVPIIITHKKRLTLAVLAFSVVLLACLRGGKDLAMNEGSQPAPTRAMRLIFEYEGNQVRLVSQQPVEMAITGSDLARVKHPGYYVDTRDGGGRTLARVPARNAFSASVEIFPQKPGEPISRVDVAQQRGAFTVVVPVPENADHFSVVQITAGRPDTQAPASRNTSPVEGGTQIVELGRFPLTANTPGGGRP